MSVSLFVVYKKPEDADEFERNYRGHMEIVRRFPGLKEARVNRVTQKLAGDLEAHVITQLVFDSMQDMQTALGSEAGKESAKDLAAWGGDKLATLMFAEDYNL